MPRHRRLVALLPMVAGAVLVAAAPARQSPPAHDARIVYRLSVPEPTHRELRVEMTVDGLTAPLDVRMSRTSPGRYALHEFAKNVFDVTASDGGGRPVAVDHVEPSRWIVSGHDGTVHFRYRVFGDRVDGTYLAVGPTHAHVNPPAAFAWPAGLDRRVVVAIAIPEGSDWRVATQLLPGDAPGTWVAPNLQYLMDSPIEVSRFVMRTFEADLPDGAPPGPRPTIAVVLHHLGGDHETAPIVDGLRRVVRSAAAVFGEYPAYEGGRYTFLLDFLPWAVGDGMEHRNSTVITGSAEGPMLARQAMETAAHEFVHGWNVERIRPLALEPFDFERPAASSELWLAEGVTSYYQDLVLARSGLASVDETIRSLQATLDALLASPALGFRSAAEMSRMASLVDGANPVDRTNWASTYLSYYTHGHALGLGFDLAIRERTGNARSLDDFMRAMWRAHGRPGGRRPGYVDAPYTLADVRAHLAEVVGDRAFADALVSRYVEGHERMDYARLLRLAGLVLRPRRPGMPSFGSTSLQPTGDGLRVVSQPPAGSPLYLAGLGEGDEITSVNGRSVSGFDALDRALARVGPGASVSLRFARRGERHEHAASVTLIEDPSIEIVPIERTGDTLGPSERRLRESWLTGR